MSGASTVLRNCTVIGCGDVEVVPDAAVHVVDGRIVEVGPDRGARGADTELDLRGGYVLPGLWDVHSHLSLMIPDPTSHSRFDTETQAALRAGHNAMDALRVGFTSLRVVGEVNGIDLAWRDAFRSGMFVGPRLFCAGHLLGSTGGHLRQSRLAPLRLEQLTTSFDGPAEALKVVRHQLHLGADLVKVAVTGGMSLHEAMDERQLETDEIGAVVAAAHARGKRVAAHAAGGPATKDALRAGVDSVEHGYVLDEECIALMAEHGTTYVPTIGVTHDPAFAQRHGWPPATQAKAAESAPAHREALEMAHRGGLRICPGGDKYPVAESGVREIELLSELGLGPLGALRAATADAAALCGVDADLGTVTPGRIADLLVLRRDPLADITAIRDVAAVLLSGRVVVDELAGPTAHPRTGAGVSVVGVPLPPPPPQPAVRPCC